MATYDPIVTLNAISDDAAAVVLVTGLSIVAMFVFFIEGAGMGSRILQFLALCRDLSDHMHLESRGAGGCTTCRYAIRILA
jgi:hypothetical protein